jgi:hypothetical protein
MGDLVKKTELEILSMFNLELDICSVERWLKTMRGIEIDPEHVFSGGVYIRQITVPAGSLIIGKRHRHETCNMLLSGEMSLYVGGGRPPERISGPLIFTSKPGVKKMAYCHTDVIFSNIHPTQETDLETIEKEFIIPEKEYRLEHKGDQLCLG